MNNVDVGFIVDVRASMNYDHLTGRSKKIHKRYAVERSVATIAAPGLSAGNKKIHRGLHNVTSTDFLVDEK